MPVSARTARIDSPIGPLNVVRFHMGAANRGESIWFASPDAQFPSLHQTALLHAAVTQATTGLNAEMDEVLEFAAVRVAPDGAVVGEFTALVQVARVPAEISRVTGITQALVDREGQSLPAAMKAFAEFVGTQPLFFHNAPFDQGFLKKAGAQTKVKLGNAVYDTLPLARQAWPSLSTYRLAALAEHIGATMPTHRGLADAKAALAVLLAARPKTGGSVG